MSSVIAKNIQIGADTTATNNFTIYQPATPNGTLLIGNGNTGITSSLVTLTSAGNVGIGTSSPGYKLSIYGTDPSIGMQANAGTADDWRLQVVGSDNRWRLLNNTSGYGEILTVTRTGNLGLGVTPSAWNAGGKTLEIGAAGNIQYGATNFFGFSQNAYYSTGWKFANPSSARASLYEQSSGAHAWNISTAAGTAGNAITFTQAMTLDASGNLLVGTTTNSNNARSRFVASGIWCIETERETTASATQIAFRNPNGIVGTISTSASTTAYNTSSDYRLKNITGPITTSGAYIDSLNPVEGTWKIDGSTFVGLIAHEAQEASRTQVATGTKDGEEMQGMSYSSSEMIANMIAELKALRARVAALETA